jgi:hypothetical protein
MAISYVLANPVHARITDDFLKYPWAKAAFYFKRMKQNGSIAVLSCYQEG